MKLFTPALLFVERQVANHPATANILRKFPEAAVREIDNYQAMGYADPDLNSRFKQEKRALILARKNGETVKEVQRDLFREIRNEYYIIHSQGCPFDCQYCFLYDYLEHQIPTIFVNVDEIIASTRSIMESKPDEALTFHTGEFSDALAYDYITELSRPLIELFASYKHARHEMRTKSDNIGNLKGLEHNGRTAVSWTFSPARVVQLMEYHTASMSERIAAARQCQEWGYPVALRLDPVVRYPEWERGYKDLIDELGQRLDPSLVRDCHLGVFRYTQGLGRIIRDRFPKSWLRLEESVPCGDGKYRYLKPLRIEMYSKIIGWLREVFPAIRIELCMDSPEVEEEVGRLAGLNRT